MSAKSKNDIAWEALFDTYQILESVESSGLCELSGVSIALSAGDEKYRWSLIAKAIPETTRIKHENFRALVSNGLV
jgi:hypothetical protein